MPVKYRNGGISAISETGPGETGVQMCVLVRIVVCARSEVAESVALATVSVPGLFWGRAATVTDSPRPQNRGVSAKTAPAGVSWHDRGANRALVRDPRAHFLGDLRAAGSLELLGHSPEDGDDGSELVRGRVAPDDPDVLLDVVGRHSGMFPCFLARWS